MERVTSSGLTARLGGQATYMCRRSRSSSAGPSSSSPLGRGRRAPTRRWVVTTAAAFGAIEFYTQWFERLGAEPWAIIIGGLTVVAFAIALWRYNLAADRPATVTA